MRHYDKGRKYCSFACFGMAHRKKVRKECAHCGKQICIIPALIRKDNYCSKACQHEGHRKAMSGAGNPRWEGGIAKEDRPIEWCEALKKKIRVRDGFICIKCGRKGLDIHHIDKDKNNNKEENLITLCHKCHMKFHSKFGKNRKREAEYWQASFWNWVGMHFEKVEQAKTENKTQKIYSIEVEKNHNFIANNFLTHNTNIIDETDMIDDESYVKIFRMLLESEDSCLIEIGNPFSLAHFYRHHNDEEWHKIHIDAQDCIAAGRLTEEGVKEQRAEMSEFEATVLLDANFPEEIDMAVFGKQAIQNMVAQKPEPAKFDKIIIGIDPAAGGRDRTVITPFGVKGNEYWQLEKDCITMDERDAMKIVGRVQELVTTKYNSMKVEIATDTVNNRGIYDRLKENGYTVREFIAGKKAYNHKRFYNYKTEVAFKCAEIGKLGLIHNVPAASRYVLQLRSWTYEVRSDKQIKIVDPEEKSPDHADSLIIALSNDIFHEDMFMAAPIDTSMPEWRWKPVRDRIRPQ